MDLFMVPFNDYGLSAYPARRDHGHHHHQHPLGELMRTMNALDRHLQQTLHQEALQSVCQNDKVALTDSGFSVNLDVSSFKPEELKIKLEENDLVVQAEHKEENEKGSVHRSFYRRFRVPEGVNVEEFKSNLTQNGQLSIQAPVIQKKPVESSKQIPIQMVQDQEKKPVEDKKK